MVAQLLRPGNPDRSSTDDDDLMAIVSAIETVFIRDGTDVGFPAFSVEASVVEAIVNLLLQMAPAVDQLA